MSGRSTFREVVATLSLALLVACQKQPSVGPKAGTVVKLTGPEIQIVDATADATTGQVAITYLLAKDGTPLTGAAATALDPAFTLAALGPDPVTQAPASAWRSLLLTGSETLDALPISPPGTPAAVALPPLPPHGQPGPDVGGAVVELGEGKFRYTYSAAVAAGSFGASETLRAGAFLRGATGSPRTTATFDFVPNRAEPAHRELVVDAQCANCHGVLKAHSGSRHGTKICVTCHTYQHADAETLDPAAILAAGTRWTPDHTNPAPNPLELGRLVHRIHRGKALPTLYKANQSSTGLAPLLGNPDPKGEKPPLPFSPSRSAQNPSIPGQEFSVIGEEGRERIFGKVFWYADANHLATDPMTANGAPLAAKLARGVTFPRDYRDCDACHATARDGQLVTTEISRRTCQGCHPDVWFGAGIPDVDKVAASRTHVAHPGQPQDDDTRCADCHVATAAKPDVLAPIGEAHVALTNHERYDKPVIEIVSVTNFKAGLTPTIVFKVKDRNGSLRPSLLAPEPAVDANPGGGKTSPVPRSFTGLTFYAAGPAVPDILTLNSSAYPMRESLNFVGTSTTPPTVLAPADANDQYTYTFTNKLPDGASGTWVVWAEGRRSISATTAVTPKFYDAVDPLGGTSGRFYWPYSGETSLTEAADNAFVWIDADVGETGPGPTGTGDATPRRMLMNVEKCNRCHLRLTYHGSRTRPEICVGCHAPDKTDYGNRPKDGNGVVLPTTFDNVEERSLHFKVLIHRIHTGSRSGPASLTLTAPYTASGSYVRTTTNATTGVITAGSSPRFRDLGEFPNDQANCTLCHDHECYHLENVPADARPTVANETSTLLHVAGAAPHTDAEKGTPPMTAACNGCHATAFAFAHAAKYVTGGKEQCVSCHGVKGAQSVDRVHGITPAP